MISWSVWFFVALFFCQYTSFLVILNGTLSDLCSRTSAKLLQVGIRLDVD
jgi:hypothetical protein